MPFSRRAAPGGPGRPWSRPRGPHTWGRLRATARGCAGADRAGVLGADAIQVGAELHPDSSDPVARLAVRGRLGIEPLRGGASPVRLRITSGSIASPSRSTRSASGTNRSNRSRTSAREWPLVRATISRIVESGIDSASISLRTARAADVESGRGSQGRQGRGRLLGRAPRPRQVAIQSAISRVARSSTHWPPIRGIRPAPSLAIR